MELPNPSSRAGKILDHDAGLGLPGEDQVERRARELASIAGLSPNEVNDGFRYQARQELRGAVDPNEANDDSGLTAELTSEDDVIGETGGPVDTLGESAAPEDDETVAEQLYAEGMAEATHDQMIESRREERRNER